jgi:CBS-domain-containing membrane protein
MGQWRVADVMTVGATSVQRDTPFREIVDILERRGINAVPVVDARWHVIGLVSSADLLCKIEAADGDLTPRLRRSRARAAGTAAADVMSTPAVTVAAQTSIVHAAKLMDRDGFKRLPVVDRDGVLVGMVTRQDLLKVFLRPDAQIRAEIVDEVLDDLAGVDPNGVTVTVDDGVATLYGRLERRSLAATLCRQVGRVDGVVDVVSHLSWDRDDTRPELIPLRPFYRAPHNNDLKEQS